MDTDHTPVRTEIRELAALGPLPSEETATEQQIARYEDLLGRIASPVSDEEARLLVHLFGPDNAYGLAWSLVHLIESAPGWPLEDCLQDQGNVRIQTLRTALENRSKLRDEMSS